MIKPRYICLAIASCILVSLSSCTGGTQTADKTQPLAINQTTETVNHSGHNSKAKININTAILSELDKFEAKLGVPALSNKIQANRPYGSPEDLVNKKVMTAEQFDQIKDMVTVEEVVLTGEAKDVDHMTKMGLMKGHLLVAQELLDQNQSKQAQPHIGHPVEEIYIDVEEQLQQRQVKEFKTTLVSLQDLVKSNPKSAKVKTDFTASVQSVEGAIAALPQAQRNKPSFVLQVINSLLDAANSEYGAAIANGKVAEAIEYQDSRGFVIYADQLYKGIATQVSQRNPQAHTAIEASLTELKTVWPSVIPPSQAVKTPQEVTQLVKTIELNSQKVIEQSSTKAQR